MKLSLIFPAYNESGSIADVLNNFVEYLKSKHVEHEIVVVDDGSTDATAYVVRQSIATHPQIHMIQHPGNQGYGAALRSGFSAASGDYIFFTDSDGQFQPDDLGQTIQLSNAQTIIIGYRQNRVEGIFRQLNANLWGMVVEGFLGLHVRDLNCAWKLFHRNLLDGVSLTSTGAFINAELLYYAKKKNITFREMPVKHFPRQAGQPTGANLQVIWRAFQELRSFYYSSKHSR